MLWLALDACSCIPIQCARSTLARLLLCRDFCNGFLFAEILSRYFPGEVQMHSFENVNSIANKQRNWQLLEKFFKASIFPIAAVACCAFYLWQA